VLAPSQQLAVQNVLNENSQLPPKCGLFGIKDINGSAIRIKGDTGAIGIVFVDRI